MNQNRPNLRFLAWFRAAQVVFVAASLAACASTTTAPHSSEMFATPNQAVDAFVTALRQDDKAQLMKILGPDSETIVNSGDPVADRAWHKKFLASYAEGHQLESEGDNKKVLSIGREEWPMPIPLINVDGGWQFDTDAGKEEILNRRIGHNELSAIEVSLAYVEAQYDYANLSQKSGGSREFAQKFISSKGKHDGLYWPVKTGESESPLGLLVAGARAEGYMSGKTHKYAPYHGYYYKILKRQGPNAGGGAKDYIVHGHMTGGFALLAFPAKYGDSGVMSFIVNENGIVHEKNLGLDTAAIAKGIDTYDPDSSWQVYAGN